MRLEQKIWAIFSLLFFLLAMASIGSYAFWFVSTIAAPELLRGVVSVLRDLHPFPALMMFPHYIPSFDNLGPLLAVLILKLFDLLKEDINIPTVSLFLCVSSTAVGFFCLLMLVRPVTNDFGILSVLCILSIFLGFQEFDFGWPTWLALSLSCLMVLLRVYLETPAENHAIRVAAVARAAIDAARAADASRAAVMLRMLLFMLHVMLMLHVLLMLQLQD